MESSFSSQAGSTDALPAVGEAEPGSVLADLDNRRRALLAEHEARTAACREIRDSRALMSLQGAPDPCPNVSRPVARPATVPADEPEPGTMAWTMWANAQNPQPAEEYRMNVAAYKRRQWETQTGRKVRSTVRRFRPNVAVSSRSRGPRGGTRRPRVRLSASRSSASSGDSPDEPGPGPSWPGDAPSRTDAQKSADPARRSDLRHISVVLADAGLLSRDAIRLGHQTSAPHAAADSSAQVDRDASTGQEGGVA